MQHVTKKLLYKSCDRIGSVNGSLKGLGGLFTVGASDICLDGDEFYGIGLLLEKLSEELSAIEDLLRCGRDSMADERNGLDEDSDDSPHMEIEDEEEAITKIVDLIRGLVKQQEA